MAKMFPKTFPEDYKSDGERKVFEYLKNNAPADWYVLHSFRLPKHRKVVFGEADFVVIVPGLGIFVLEVKGGGVGFDGSNWIFINREQKKTIKQRGPFQQGREAMFEIEKIITDKLGDDFARTSILYGYGVVFTDERNFPTSAITEDETWRLCQRTDNVDYCAFIRKLHKNFVEELKQLNKNIPSELSSSAAELIVKQLRPIVDCVVPLKSFVQASENDIVSLTEEQYDCLDDIEMNHRVVVTGGAGTGKTLLAVEQAKRCVETESVAIFCFNKNLAEHIKNNINDQRVTVYSLHSYLTKLCGANIDVFEKNEEYFEKTLPLLACDEAKAKGILFDRLIIDEFQDLCIEEYLHFFDVILKGGLFDGKFTFYGDFARQAIYAENASLNALEKISFFARKHLSINCRNTKHIGNELINITRYEDKKYKLKITGEPVDFFVWNSEDEQKRILDNCIEELRKKGFLSASIMILSPKRRENSIVNLCDPKHFIIGNYGEESEAYFAMFSTVQAFKGLESEIVILTDIDNYSDSKLMYIALSRARSKLIVLESNQASKQRKKLIIAR